MGYKRSRANNPIKDVYCYAVSTGKYDYAYLIYSRVSLDENLQGKRLKIADLSDSPILSYAKSIANEDCCGGMGWREYTVTHPAHGHHNLLQHLQDNDIYTANNKQCTDDNATVQDTIMGQMEQNILSNTNSSVVYHAISIKDKKWVTLRVTRMQTQTTFDDLHKTITELKKALLAVNTTLCCHECSKTINSPDDLVMTPSGDMYCQTCY